VGGILIYRIQASISKEIINISPVDYTHVHPDKWPTNCSNFVPAMISVNFTVVKQRANPLVQAVVALVIGFAGILICKITHPMPGGEYLGAITGIIFFTIINTVVSIAYSSFIRYTMVSYNLYIFLLIILLLSSKFTSGISIWNLAPIRNMVGVVTLFYLIVSLLVRLLRAIYELAESDT
jgi:hypothetical protein